MFKPVRRRRKPVDKIVYMYPFDSKEYNNNIKFCNVKIREYLVFCDYKHPLAYKSTGHVYYHRHVASLMMGRWMTKDDIVHHINGDKLDNRKENLHVVNRREHIHEHKDNEGKTKTK